MGVLHCLLRALLNPTRAHFTIITVVALLAHGFQIFV